MLNTIKFCPVYIYCKYEDTFSKFYKCPLKGDNKKSRWNVLAIFNFLLLKQTNLEPVIIWYKQELKVELSMEIWNVSKRKQPRKKSRTRHM